MYVKKNIEHIVTNSKILVEFQDISNQLFEVTLLKKGDEVIFSFNHTVDYQKYCSNIGVDIKINMPTIQTFIASVDYIKSVFIQIK